MDKSTSPFVSKLHHYVTYFDKNYLIKGCTLLTSLLRHDPRANIKVICLDDDTFQMVARLNLAGVEPIPLALFEKRDAALAKSRADRTLVEYYWTLTPTLIQGCMDLIPDCSSITYVDADMFFFSTPAPLFDELADNDVLIHRHNFSSTSKNLEIYGIYNVGLMIFRNSDEGRRILTWWRNKCLDWCKDTIEDDPDGGTRYGDQKYLEYFEKMSSTVRICEHLGAGVAPWNHSQYALSLVDNVPHVDGQPTIFYHYHSFTLMTPGCALPNANAYRCTLDIMRIFFAPYFTALQESLMTLRTVRPDFNHGFHPHAMKDGLCIMADKEMENEIAPAFPLRVILNDTCILGAERQLDEYESLIREHAPRKARSLKQALAAYRRIAAKPRLLNLGCGCHFHTDWMNVDIHPFHPAVYDVDLRKRWPLPANFFDMAYHSHVLEHMSEGEGHTFLRKCFDVLKPGGILRVAIPDLESIARHYIAALDEAKRGEAGAAHRRKWMLVELIDQISRHHSGGAWVEYFKQSPLPEKDFVLSRVGWEGEQLANVMQGQPLRSEEESDPAVVGAFRLSGEVHRWMYDAFSLQQALEAAGFQKAHVVGATESAYPGFASFCLDADSAGKTRKPDSLFMEAQKPQTIAGLSPGSMHIEVPHYDPSSAAADYWNDPFSDWKSACAAAEGYDSEIIFTKIRAAARAVRDGKAIWERDSVLFHTAQYNEPLLAALKQVASMHDDHLHVLDFGGAFGSTYMQNRSALNIIKLCTWHIVEQEHIVQCGKQEFANANLKFHYTMQEAFAEAPINTILFSSVLQYVENPYEFLHQAIAHNTAIIFDRTPLLPEGERIIVQHVPAEIYSASYPMRWLDQKRIFDILHSHSYTICAFFQSAVDPEGFYGFLALPHAMLEQSVTSMAQDYSKNACATATAQQSVHIDHIPPAKAEHSAPLRIMQVDRYYSEFLENFYASNTSLRNASSHVQEEALFRSGFSAIHAIVPYLQNLGCKTDYFISNAQPSQQAWAKEQGIAIPSHFDEEGELHLLRQRIARFRPDVLYLADVLQCDAAFLHSLDYKPACIMGWRAADVPLGTDWTGYDIILSGLPRLLTLAESLGAKKGILFHPGMPRWIAREVQNIPQDTDVVFAGSISPTQHVRRLALLEELALAATNQGFSLSLHLMCDEALISPSMRPFVRPPVFGLDMHKALRRGKIVLDVQGTIGLRKADGSYALDLAQGDTANMRLFEATGGGSLLLTDALPGLARYFAPDTEVQTFRDGQEMIEKIVYYLNNGEQRQSIASAGQNRCLGEHDIRLQAQAFLTIAKDHLTQNTSILSLRSSSI